MTDARMLRRWLPCLVLCCLLAGESAFAQLPAEPQREVGTGRWGLVDAVGYGGLGFLTGLAASWDSDLGEGVATIGLTTLTGFVTGAAIGHRASNRIRSGAPPTGGTRFVVSAGAILAGATLGACAAVPLFNGEGEGTPLGSDETALAILMGGGTLLGAWYLHRHTSDFNGTRLGITPIRTRDSAYGLRVSVRY